MSPRTSVTAKSIKYEASVWLEGQTYVAQAWPLDVASCGDSEAQALKMLEEAVGLVVDTPRENGTLDIILEEAGYRA